jgi:hypothetical protein
MVGKSHRLLRRIGPPPEILLFIASGIFFGNENIPPGGEGGLLAICAKRGCKWGRFFPRGLPRECPLCHTPDPRHARNGRVTIYCLADGIPRCTNLVTAKYKMGKSTRMNFLCSRHVRG